MSEYIEIESELNDDGSVMYVYTNLTLSDEAKEQYSSPEEMAEGSPIAQALAVIDGLASLHIENSDMSITRRLEVEWHMIINDVAAVIKDFFL
jgi:hypothetical protein